MNNFLKSLSLGIVATFLVMGSAAANTLYTWQSDPVDLYGLDHYHDYTWGIDVTEPLKSKDNIAKVSLTFTNIHNWNNEEIDELIEYWDHGKFVFNFDQTKHSKNNNGWKNSNGKNHAPVPEPDTMLLFGIGLIGIAGVARVKTKA